MEEKFIGVKSIDNGKGLDIQIVFNNEEDVLPIEESIMVLSSGISLLLNAVTNDKAETNKKDYELLKWVIDYLTSEFVNLESFNNVYVNGGMGEETKR